MSNWLKKIDKNQEAFNKEKKYKEKIRNQATLSKYMIGK